MALSNATKAKLRKIPKLHGILVDKTPKELDKILDIHAQEEGDDLKNWLENKPDIDELVDLILEYFPKTIEETYE